MTSSDDEYGQASNNNNLTNQHNNYNRRMNNNSNNPYSSGSGIEIRLLMTSRDAGAVIGLYQNFLLIKEKQYYFRVFFSSYLR